MGMDGQVSRFGVFEFDRANRQLRRAGAPVELGSRYFDALGLLLREPGALVTKDRFMDEVWRGIPVTDEALTQCIRTLRRALGDEATAPRFIETVPKHGYRFVGTLEVDKLGQQAGGSATAALGGSRLAGASTIGGAIAGFAGGAIYGLAATEHGGGTVLVLVALGAALGVLGGAGVGLGMALARIWRPVRIWPLAAGGGAGGMLVGALGQVLSLDGVALLTGAAVGPVTGLFEGLILGLAAGAATGLALSGRAGARLALATAIGAGAGALASLAGGRLFAGSLHALQARFPNSGLAMERIGWAAREEQFGPGSLAMTTILEAAAFVACVAAANRFFQGRRP